MDSGRFFIPIYQILKDFFVNFSAGLNKFFGYDYFPVIEYSFSDYTFTIKKLLDEKQINIPRKVFFEVSDFYPVEQFNRIPIVSAAPFGNNVFEQYICVNETKNQAILASNQLFQFNFTMRIFDNSNLNAVQIKHVLQSLFPPGSYFYFPSPTSKIISFIPLYNFEDNLPDWDLENDEIYYLYVNTDYITGKSNIVFAPFEMRPLVQVADNIDNSQKRDLLQSSLYSKIEISFNVILELPIQLIVIGTSYPDKITLRIAPYNEYRYFATAATSYTPIDIYKNYSSQYSLSSYVISTYFTNENIINEDERFLTLKFSLDVDSLSNTDKYGCFIPVNSNLYSNLNNDFIIEEINSNKLEKHLRLDKNVISPDVISDFKNGNIRLDIHIFKRK